MIKKRFVAFICLVCLLLPALFACGGGDGEQSQDPGGEGGFVFAVGKKEFVADVIDGDPADGRIAIYTRNYTVDGKLKLTVDASAGRTLLSVNYVELNDGGEFSVEEITADSGVSHIPVNGFVASLPSSELEGVRYGAGSLVTAEGYGDLVSGYETHSYATLNIADASVTVERRINLVDPLVDLTADRIYLITPEYGASAAAPQGSVLVTASQVTKYKYTVDSVSAAGSETAPGEGKVKLIFCGEYNNAYVDAYIKDGVQIMINSTEKANPYSDTAAAVINGKTLGFADGNVNAASIDNDGIYIFDSSFSSEATPVCASEERVDITVVSDMIAEISPKGVRTLIPSGGVTITLVGAANTALAEEMTEGEPVDLLFVIPPSPGEKYACIGGKFFNIDFVDGIRQPEGVCVLYTPDYGATTGTNGYGTEIVVSDGAVTEVNVGKGDSAIPSDGFVVSVHKDNAMINAAKNVSVGESAKVSLSPYNYSVSKLTFDGKNTTRSADTLIVYDRSGTTGTNIYGYEIIVDGDGRITGYSDSGNSTIPAGGFVLSAHGEKINPLRAVYTYGAKVFVIDSEKTVLIIRTPDLKIRKAIDEYNSAVDELEEARKNLLNIDYPSANAGLAELETTIEAAQKAYAEYDFAAASEYADSILSSISRIRYGMIESHAVENRAVWYRADEKNEDEVRATVEKMKKLNVNTLYIETWYGGRCIGYIDVDAVEHCYANPDFDVLDAFIRICHENGIEVHAWVENFFVGHVQGDSFTSKIAIKYADKLLLDKAGRNYFYYKENSSFVFMNPYDRECRDTILEVYRELVTKYDLDGIHLDYIRFPEPNWLNGKEDFGYNDDIIAAFAKETGITADPHTFTEGSANWQKWVDFRCGIITSFVEEAVELVRGIDPDIWISAATYPVPSDARVNIFQDVETWVKKGLLDEVFSMTYGTDNAYVFDKAAVYVEFCSGNAFYSTGIAAFMETSQHEFAYQMTEVREAGADGVAVFSLGSIFPYTYQYEMTYGAFRDPSVQVYKLSKTVSAGLKELDGKLDNLSSVYTSVTADHISQIKALTAVIESEAAAFDPDTASLKEKIDYCKKAAGELKKLAKSIKEICGDNSESADLVKDVGLLEYWMDLSAKRLEVRK
ncbi:MAG: family 10 glycosylhydrolase [Clostridia bacterium]|nr:family 10 glycosylhydrolase [Clostridia bacterium]